SAKQLIGDSSGTAAELAAAATTWNAQAGGAGAISKYVNSVLLNNTTGEITVTFNNANVGNIPASSALVYTPYVMGGTTPTALATSFTATPPVTGSIDWGCASSTNAVSGTARSLPVITAATVALPAQFAPSECR